MPNWCKNNLKIESNGEKVLDLLELIRNDKGEMTFSKLVPLPDELKDTTSPVRSTVSQEERSRLMAKYGADNWYDWQCKNWGCKWDASESEFWEDGGDWMVTFLTPWRPPIEFMRNLSKQFDKITFTLQFADECLGHYPLGEVIFMGGEEYKDCRPEGGSDKAKKLADAVWGEEWATLD